jgi:5-methylcytosine-specific restriction enzyme A
MRTFPRLPDVATTVDHTVPHRGNETLFWDRGNLKAMSAAHHSRKTAGETMHAR